MSDLTNQLSDEKYYDRPEVSNTRYRCLESGSRFIVSWRIYLSFVIWGQVLKSEYSEISLWEMSRLPIETFDLAHV